MPVSAQTLVSRPDEATGHPLLNARYGQAGSMIGAILNPTIEGLLAHRSVRAYLPAPQVPVLPPKKLPTK